MSHLSTSHPLPRYAAQALSLLFHPLAMVLWMAIVSMMGVVGKIAYPEQVRWYVVGTVAFMTILIPCIFLWLLRVFGVTQKGEGEQRRHRIMMLVVVAVCYTCCGWVFDNVVALYLVRKILYTATAVVLLLLLFELFYPLSYHTTALGALLGMVWMLLLVGNVALLAPFIVGIVAVGLLATSRIYMGGCSLGGAAWGALLGFALSAGVLVVI